MGLRLYFVTPYGLLHEDVYMQQLNEPPRDKTNKIAYAPSDDSDQPGRPPSLIASSLCAQWVAKDPSFLPADSEDSDQIGPTPRII